MVFISAKELNDKKSSSSAVTVVDIREPYELDICKIESLHIPMAEVAERVHEIPKDGEVVILCRSGKRALAVANLLISDFGRENISILEGGILAWIEEVDNQLEAY